MIDSIQIIERLTHKLVIEKTFTIPSFWTSFPVKRVHFLSIQVTSAHVASCSLFMCGLQIPLYSNEIYSYCL